MLHILFTSDSSFGPLHPPSSSPSPSPSLPCLLFCSSCFSPEEEEEEEEGGGGGGKGEGGLGTRLFIISNLQIIRLLIAVGLPEVLQLARVEVSDWHAPFRPNDNA